MKSLTIHKSIGGRSKMLLAILDTFQAIMSKRKSCSVFKNMSKSPIDYLDRNVYHLTRKRADISLYLNLFPGGMSAICHVNAPSRC